MIKLQYASNYMADNPDYRVFNEERKITQEVDKVIVLDFGAFFTESLTIRNKATGLKLRKGQDYDCRQLDYVATRESGKEVTTQIFIKTDAVKEIQYDYMFVGGDHMSGLHLLKAMREKYPDGIRNTYHWDKVTNKPETFRPKFHHMHVNDIYGLDGANSSIERVIAGLKKPLTERTTNIQKMVTDYLAGMSDSLTDTIENLDQLLQDSFNNLSVQDGEYIFTDSVINPAVSRGYGNWVRVTNKVLRGTNGEVSFAVDDGNVLAKGFDIVLRNCYIWRNEQTEFHPTYALTVLPHEGLSNNQRAEEKDITFSLQTTGITEGGKVSWILLDKATGKSVGRDVIYGDSLGEFTIDSVGRATTVVKFKADYNTARLNKNYVMRLTRSADVSAEIIVLDTSAQKWVTVTFTSDINGVEPISVVSEGQDFYLQINTLGYALGESIFLDWSYSSMTQSEMMEPLPTILSNPTSNKVSIKLKAKEDTLTDGARALLVYVVNQLKDPVTESTPHALVTVTDTSRFEYADISFNSGGNVNIFEMDEGAAFSIVIKTPLPNTEIELMYESSRALSDFIGLTSLVTTNNNGQVTLQVTNVEDFLTANGTQNLTVITYHRDREIGRNQVFFKDTSKTPNYVMFYSTTPGGATVTRIAEGVTFFLNIQVVGWTQPTRPPVLNFLYYLNDNPSTSMVEMNSRITSTFYENMTFDQSSNVFNEVSWVNGNTLVLEMSLLANRLIDGDDTLCIAMKQHNENEYNRVARLTLLDTSIYDITATWSSSATTLTPITQANEMLSSGLNNTAYLWIDVDGDGSLLGDIELTSTSIAGVDFIDVFPKTINFSSGVRRQIIAVTLYADFTDDGDKNVTINGTYTVGQDGRLVEIFNSPLNIVNNSIVTDINMAISTSNTNIVNPDNKFSEWVPLYAHIDFPAFAFESYVEWSIFYTRGSNQFEVESGVVQVTANNSIVKFRIDPKRDRIADGEASFGIRYRRFIKGDDRPITTLKSLTGLTLLDDSLPPSVILRAYTNEERTTLATTASEGQTLYLRAIVNNPDRNASGVIRLTNTTNVDKLVNGVSSTCYGVNTLGTKLAFSDESKILGNYTLSDDNKVYNLDSIIVVAADRVTNPKQAVLDLTVELLDNPTNLTVGSTITRTYMDDNRITSGGLTLPISDTSKTASYSVTGVPTSINEGDEFEIILNITNGTVGDVYYPNLTSDFPVSRLTGSEFGVEQVSVVENDIIKWKVKVAKNYKTDTGVNVIGFSVINKTLGTNIASESVTVNDTSRTPDFAAYLSLPNNIGEVYTVSEGQSQMHLVVAGLVDLDLDDSILVERVSGRAASEFPSGTFTTHRVTDLSFGNANLRGIAIPFYPRYDRLTNTAEQNTIVLKITSVLSGVSKTITVDILDTSKDMAFLASRWVKAGTTTVVTSVNEGEAVELQVQTTGGDETIALTCTNNNGRDVAKLTVSSYGVSKNRTSDTQWVSFPFTPSNDLTSNTDNDLRLSVRISVGGSTTTFDSTLPINDTSYNAGYTLKVIETGDTTQKAVSFMNENKSYQVIAVATGVPIGASISLIANSNSYYHTVEHEQTVSDHNGDVTFNTLTTTLTNTERTPSTNLWYKAEILLNGTSVSSVNIPVIDTGVPNISARLTAIDNINTAITTTVSGNTVTLVVDPDQLTGVNWNYGTGHLIRWRLVDAFNNEVLDNPTTNSSNKTFNLTNLTTFNGGKGYKVNIPLNIVLADKTVKVVFTEEYTIGGSLQVIELGSTENLRILNSATAPAITDIYWSNNQDGIGSKLTRINEGDMVYLVIKTANIPLNTVINLNWEGSTTNSNDFTTGTTDSNTTVKVTTFNTSNSTGLAFYKFVSKHDEMVDDGN